MRQLEVRLDGTLRLLPDASSSQEVSAQSQDSSPNAAESYAVAAFRSIPQIGALANAGLFLKDGGQVRPRRSPSIAVIPSQGCLVYVKQCTQMAQCCLGNVSGMQLA